MYVKNERRKKKRKKNEEKVWFRWERERGKEERMRIIYDGRAHAVSKDIFANKGVCSVCFFLFLLLWKNTTPPVSSFVPLGASSTTPLRWLPLHTYLYLYYHTHVYVRVCVYFMYVCLRPFSLLHIYNSSDFSLIWREQRKFRIAGRMCIYWTFFFS